MTLVVGQAIYAAQVDMTGGFLVRLLIASFVQVGHGPRVVIVQDILIKLANDTNVRVARAFFNPVKIPLKTDTTVFFIIYMRATQN